MSFKRHEIKVTLGYSSSSEVMIEPLYSFMFSENLGVATGVMLLTEKFGYPIISKENSAPKWSIPKNQIAAHILFRSNMVFRFPILKQEKQNVLFLTFEPGFFINPISKRLVAFSYTDHNILDPKRSQHVWTQRKLWVYYNFRASISVDLDMFRVGVGYTMSNYDIYDDIRTAKIGNESLSEYLRKKRLTHFPEANISFSF